MTWIFRIQSKHKRVFAKQSKPERWHQKSALLGILILLSKSMGVLSMIPVTWQSLLFLQTWSLRDISNLRTPVSVNWTSFPVSYWLLALIGNDKNAAWLHLLQGMFPWPWAQQLPKMELGLQGWMRDVWQWLLTTQELSWCTCIPSLLQGWEPMCVPVQDPCPSHCVQSTGLNKHWVGEEPTSHTSCLKAEALQAPDFTVWRFPPAEVIPAACSLGALYTMKTNEQNPGLFQCRIWSQELYPFLKAD